MNDLRQVVIYAGPEAPDGEWLATASGCPVLRRPRELAAVADRDRPLLVVPASTGRDLTSITHAAQGLQWLRSQGFAVCLAEAVANDTYTIARLRHHLRALDAGGAVGALVVAHEVNPFADAELLRRVRLAQQFSRHNLVEVAFEGPGGWPDVDRATDRLVALGAERIVHIRGDLGGGSASEATPLFSAQGLRRAVELAAERGLRLWESTGDDGIALGLLADHGQGFAHSHGEEEQHSHGHSHTHSHSHGHSHPHHHSYPHTH
ncbi:hypothetical protein DLJ54_05355 [Corynebacterium heidelbergense]|uniref:Cobalamin biosynthesis protein CbiX n=1 Tax=Corynebacterium heidelbergense TaxID=2055947 RepID=A0A364V5W1_9CORY|nr:hypothetical protein DLJ54_05355 [Corynebacterium heidelbergense]